MCSPQWVEEPVSMVVSVATISPWLVTVDRRWIACRCHQGVAGLPCDSQEGIHPALQTFHGQDNRWGTRSKPAEIPWIFMWIIWNVLICVSCVKMKCEWCQWTLYGGKSLDCYVLWFGFQMLGSPQFLQCILFSQAFKSDRALRCEGGEQSRVFLQRLQEEKSRAHRG